MSLVPGTKLGPYKILAPLGEGGMGVVYRAVDTRLDRTVAIKLLRPETAGSDERKRRFIQEAKAASALNHPNIVNIYDVGSATTPQGEVDFITMEYVQGTPLQDRIAAKASVGEGLPLEVALGHGVQIAEGLAAAHSAGIVHRDVKPGNIMVTEAGQIKILDFGLAKLLERGEVDESATTLTAGARTEEGAVVGTAAYMSPEQAEGTAVDARSDIFSFGIVFYEMLSGRRPFKGDSHSSMRMSILHDDPPPLKEVARSVPAELGRIVRRCLEKRKETRYPSANELVKDLTRFQASLGGTKVELKVLLRRPRFVVATAALLLAALAVGVLLWVRVSGVRWAREVALAQIVELRHQQRFTEAFLMARQAERYIPDDTTLRELQLASSAPATIRTSPEEADIFFKDYQAFDTEWQKLGRSPVINTRVPAGYLRWRIEKDGYHPVEGAFGGWGGLDIKFTLHADESYPAGMVYVPPGSYLRPRPPPEPLDEFWMDQYEVTNGEFKKFMDGGGYQRLEYWHHPFIKDGDETLSREEAIELFRDSTGQQGPTTWELGQYGEGEADLPVGGVSWYEASAYCESMGKTLPTIYHWYRTAGFSIFSDEVLLSNFGGKTPIRVGTLGGLGPYGTYDMAGNVKEWCWNAAGDLRYVMGGAWNEPSYVFGLEGALSPFDRAATSGFRCAKYLTPSSDVLLAPLERPSVEYRPNPVTDETFAVYKSMYAYDASELNAVVQSSEDTSPYWRKETIAFDAAYGGERVTAYLFLPTNAAPPYQTVVYFPTGAAWILRSNREIGTEMAFVDFIPRSGRALLFPIYKGTYERRLPDQEQERIENPGSRVWRDVVIQTQKDLSRSVDYLATRPDVDHDRLAYLGFSNGAVLGPIFTALDGRFKASILLAGGFYPEETKFPEVNHMLFAPRSTVPVLMINARNDLAVPVETSQLPFFRALGAAEGQKRHVILDGGHYPSKTNEVVRESLQWLDHYLGPVQKAQAQSSLSK